MRISSGLFGHSRMRLHRRTFAFAIAVILTLGAAGGAAPEIGDEAFGETDCLAEACGEAHLEGAEEALGEAMRVELLQVALTPTAHSRGDAKAAAVTPPPEAQQRMGRPEVLAAAVLRGSGVWAGAGAPKAAEATSELSVGTEAKQEAPGHQDVCWSLYIQAKTMGESCMEKNYERPKVTLGDFSQFKNGICQCSRLFDEATLKCRGDRLMGIDVMDTSAYYASVCTGLTYASWWAHFWWLWLLLTLCFCGCCCFCCCRRK